MKKAIIGILAVSLLLVGCGSNSRTGGVDLAIKPPWVASFSEGHPTVYYVSTGEKVQNVGKQIFVINPKNPNDGPNEWTSDQTEATPIEVYTIPGIDVTKVIAVKFVKDGPFIKAVAQSKKP